MLELLVKVATAPPGNPPSQPTPPLSTGARPLSPRLASVISALWFSSVFLALGVAIVCLLVKPWINFDAPTEVHVEDPQPHSRHLHERGTRFTIGYLGGLLVVSLLLFCAGLLTLCSVSGGGVFVSSIVSIVMALAPSLLSLAVLSVYKIRGHAHSHSTPLAVVAVVVQVVSAYMSSLGKRLGTLSLCIQWAAHTLPGMLRAGVVAVMAGELRAEALSAP